LQPSPADPFMLVPNRTPCSEASTVSVPEQMSGTVGVGEGDIVGLGTLPGTAYATAMNPAPTSGAESLVKVTKADAKLRLGRRSYGG